ncbi:MAG TPA: GGDEF domain-containing protein [Methylotenera sp.]|nr:GGDEF domain-containing protein [Methylotenera sp.]
MQNTLQEHIKDNFLSEAQSQHTPFQSNQTRDKQQHIRVEKIKLLYQHSLTPIILSAVAGLFLVAALWKSANHQHLLIWLATTFVFACVRIWLMMQFERKKPQGSAVLKWEKPYAISLMAVFLVWSLGLICIMPRDNLSAVFILNTFSIGLAGAAISWYSPLRYLQMATISLALIPMIIVLLTLGQEETFWVGIAACCMYVSCMITSVLLQKTFNGNLELAYDLEQAKKQAENLARTDALTGLNNRRAFFDKAEPLFAYCKRSQQPVSALMLDVDHFKKINDSYGHAAGDIALRNLAKLIKTNLRDSDLACRFGGEEFAVLLPNTNAEEAMGMANMLKQLMASTIIALADENALSLTASFGIAENGETVEDLLNHADKAMYAAKNSGRNHVMSYCHISKQFA